jgi:sterol desaturase/sphingolipid hydroxylase (fatty acid hydroxylase superfamily)
MNELGSYAFADLRVGMCATFAKTVTEADIVLFAAVFAGLLLGYLAFIMVHYAVHRWPIEPNSWLYSAKVRHLTHHRFDNFNYGVTTIFWDIVFRTNARIIGERIRSGAG